MLEHAVMDIEVRSDSVAPHYVRLMRAHTLDQLRDLCRELGMCGVSRLAKHDLARRLASNLEAREDRETESESIP